MSLFCIESGILFPFTSYLWGGRACWMGGVGEAPRKLFPPVGKQRVLFLLLVLIVFVHQMIQLYQQQSQLVYIFSLSLKNNKTRSLSSGWKHHMQEQQPVPASSRCSAVWSYGLELWELWDVTPSSYLFIYLFIKFVSHTPARSINNTGQKMERELQKTVLKIHI